MEWNVAQALPVTGPGGCGRVLRGLTPNGLLQSHPGGPGLSAVREALVLTSCGKNTSTCPALVRLNCTGTFPYALFNLTYPQTF